MRPRTSALLASAAALAIFGLTALPPFAARAQEKPPAADMSGPRETADAELRKALKWLKDQQQPNGAFGKIPGQEGAGEAGMSALALRAFAKAPPALRAELGLDASMEKIASYLVGLQQGDGSIANPQSGLTTYRTSIAIMALAAYDVKRFAEPIGKARTFLEHGQFSEANLGGDAAAAKKNPNYGGWGYDKTGTRPQADMSNSHFALEALKEAGLSPDSEVWKRAATFLQRCQNRSESNDLTPAGVEVSDDGGFVYDPFVDEGKSEPVVKPNGKKQIPSYASITYAGLMSMLYANLKKDDPRVHGAYAWIEKNYTLEENRGMGPRASPKSKQGLYYFFNTFAKALAAWGEATVTAPDGVQHYWAQDLARRLSELQRADGSWANDTKRWWEDDPILCTCYAVLAIETAYHPWLDGGTYPAAKPAAPPTTPGAEKPGEGK